MKRNCSMDEISDGSLYNSEDLVEAHCNGCKGNASCCRGMGNSIVLDPLDLFQLQTKLNLTFEQLLADRIELNIVDSVILPNLKMTGQSEICSFLNEKGRCSIHSYRPGICRLFPLGRYYENHRFQYFLQKSECKNNSITKTKVSKWLDTPELSKYEKFITDWHYLLIDVESVIKSSQDEKLIKDINMYILNYFYVKQYDVNTDFYEQFYERLEETKSLF